VTEFAHPATDYAVVEREPTDVMRRNLLIGARLWSAAMVVYFFAFFFAFFYLHSLNSGGLFKPKGVDAPEGWGLAIVLCVAASAVLLASGVADQRADRRPRWRLKGFAAFALGLAAFVVQIVTWTRIGFGPTDGGYASVYIGWTAMYELFLVGMLYWLETCLALSYRYRAHAFGRAEPEPGHAAGDPHREQPDIENPVHLNTAELAALTFSWWTFAVIGVVMWLVLYLD
jgi:heme/copper-type cytochrome/quinol oxidase subunit 3